MSLHPAPPFSLDFFGSRPVEVEISSAPLSSDAGHLPIRQFDQWARPCRWYNQPGKIAPAFTPRERLRWL